MTNNWIIVVQTGSPIRRHHSQRETLIGLGLNGIRRARVLPDTPEVRGMIRKVSHLVQVLEGPLMGAPTRAMKNDLDVLRRFNRRATRTEQSAFWKRYADQIPSVVSRMENMKLQKTGPSTFTMQGTIYSSLEDFDQDEIAAFVLDYRQYTQNNDAISISSLARIYGKAWMQVHHCLYCDGFEYAGKSVAALGKGDKGADLAVMMKHWIADVVACSDGAEVSADAARKLKQHGIPLRSEPVVALEGADGVLTKIKFQSGTELERAGLFFSTGCRQASDLSRRLGCKRDEKGGVVKDPATEEASVPGVYVAGDVSRDVLLVSIAIAEGAKAAVAINKAFLRRDGFCD